MVIPNEAAQPLCFPLALLHPQKLGLTPSSDCSHPFPKPQGGRGCGDQPPQTPNVASPGLGSTSPPPTQIHPGSSRELHELMAGTEPAAGKGQRGKREGSTRKRRIGEEKRKGKRKGRKGKREMYVFLD